MKRYLLTGCFGKTDRPAVKSGVDEEVYYLDLVKTNKRIDFGIGHALEDLSRLHIYPSEVGVDLLVLAALVHAADTRISREEQSQDSWTREVRLIVPVSDPLLWEQARDVLHRMLKFLTGDQWEIEFRARPEGFESIVPAHSTPLLPLPYDSLALFSGGLDSLIDAVNSLEQGKTPLLVSHAGEGITSSAQYQLFDALKQHFPNSTMERLRLWMVFPENLIPDAGSENSTRGRSFLFFAAGIFAATGLPQVSELRVPENGLIALNVPLDPLRLGSLSTRTTHPYYIARWNELLSTLGIAPRVTNPYWDKTKGEMTGQCLNPALLKQLSTLSLSCSSPGKARWNGVGIQHCGFCLPCLIRRAALDAGFGRGVDQTSYTLTTKELHANALNTNEAEGKQIRSFQFAIQRLRQKPTSARLLIHKPGPLIDDPTQWEALADVYRRGLEEVAALIDGVTTSPK
ncbi:Qat anti-phage system QueC-like protein QatC [Chromobacterium alticapitis]|uniref:Uncharacterized protein n=1 Tax=Chromobacterium alticapitis TaxID=2073169 RepID=A0A2S5DC96_9NEIS|nr:Qat anti-phage system QueC-like protein QatC [Chromobacterium alticapitis]POZ60706.1 hypothetical protein C2I19_17430 [Chromobacterium alticapitis]